MAAEGLSAWLMLRLAVPGIRRSHPAAPMAGSAEVGRVGPPDGESQGPRWPLLSLSLVSPCQFGGWWSGAGWPGVVLR